MAGLKKDLKDAREKRNLTVQQVAALTNIKTEHIRALEEGNYEFFSAPIYIRGFVRSIAIALKMDLAQTMSTLDLELEDEKHQLKNADLDTKTEESAVEDEEKDEKQILSLIPWKWVFIAFAAALVSGGGIYGFLLMQKNKSNSNEPEIQNTTPGLIQRPYDGSLEIPATNLVEQI